MFVHSLIKYITFFSGNVVYYNQLCVFSKNLVILIYTEGVFKALYKTQCYTRTHRRKRYRDPGETRFNA